MDSSLAFNKVLAEQCDEQYVTYFATGLVTQENGKSDTFYIIIGEIGISFAYRSFTHILQGGRIPFDAIVRVKRQISDDETFELTLDPNGTEEEFFWDTNTLIIKSPFREILLKHLEVGYRVTQMIIHGSTNFLPSYDGNVESRKIEDGEEDRLPEIAPFKNQIKVTYDDYTFMMTGSFTPIPTWTSSHSISSNFTDDSRGLTVELFVSPSQCLDLLSEGDTVPISALADAHKTSLIQDQPGLYFLLSSPHIKRFNLVDDRACWRGWKIVAKTLDGYIAVVLFRRSYLPPLMDNYQDIIITMKAPNQFVGSGTILPLIDECLAIGDSCSSLTVSQEYYYPLIQARVDALLLPPSTLRWLAIRHKILPRVIVRCWKLIRILVELLKKNSRSKFSQEFLFNIDKAKRAQLSPIEQEESKMFSHPSEFASHYLQKFIIRSPTPGIDNLSEAPRALRVKSLWTQRLASYLALLIDGGMAGNNLSLELIASASLAADEQTETFLDNLINFLLHIRSSDLTVPFNEKIEMSDQIKSLMLNIATQGTSTSSTVTLSDALNSFVPPLDLKSQLFTFGINNAIVTALVSNGYFKRLLNSIERNAPEQQILAHEDIFCVMLSSSLSMSAPFKFRILRRFLEKELSDELTSTEELPLLLTAACAAVLKDCENSAPLLSSNLSKCAVSLLVNLSSGNEAVKMILINSSVPEMICSVCQRWSEVDHTVIDNLIKLTLRLVKSPPNRMRIVGAGLVPALVDILADIYAAVSEPLRKLFLSISGVIGHLCQEPLVMEIFTTSLPVLDFLLYFWSTCGPSDLPDLTPLLFTLRLICKFDPRHQRRVGVHCLHSAATFLLSPNLDATFAVDCLHFISEMMENRQNVEELKNLPLWKRCSDRLRPISSPAVIRVVDSIDEAIMSLRNYETMAIELSAI